MARADCPHCDGSGWKTIAQGESRVAVRCECAAEERTAHTLARARIPQRYLHCDFQSFDADLQYDHGPAAELAAWNRSLEQARVVVQGFARDYPVGIEHGLLLMGPCGVGKTHLAVAALQEIVLRGHTGLFYDYRELLKEIQGSYNPESPATELGVLDPVLTAEVLLLDDLGASKPSLWALETLGHILNARYNAQRVTLVTTNFQDAESAANVPRLPSGRPAAVEDTLAERVGMRIRSRLYEMCRTLEIVAPDYRKEIRQASRFRA
ncbi:MAG TPA: ATP-binding protein [Candidatus Acidoferrales bacterium]|jgi:DNA replication protein DnaC|nr:ATP-binding protein [Candidatus Acidoferrales bacterium]